jgi:hypothetical protein
MFSIRNSGTRHSGTRHSGTRLVGAAAGVVIAALSLTACNNDGTGVNGQGASAGDSTSTSLSTSVPSASASTAGGSSSPTTAPATKGAAPAGSQPTAAAAAKAPASSGKPVTCEGSNTKVVAAPLTRPVNHMLLTVTNTGKSTCYLYEYPALDFSDAQSVPPAIEDSKPQAVTTLEPGESGYASVALSAGDGSGANARTVKSLAVDFYGRSGAGNGSVGAAAHPLLPAAGVSIDDSLTTTYWLQSMDDALGW